MNVNLAITRNTLFLAALMFFPSSCSPQITRQDVIGVYRANHGHGIEILELFSNGKYVHTYAVGGHSLINSENTWEFEPDNDGSPALTLKEYTSGYLDNPPPTGIHAGYWHVRVERTWLGHIELNIDPDLAYFYIKM